MENKTVLLRECKRRTACAPAFRSFQNVCPKCLFNFLSKIQSNYLSKFGPPHKFKGVPLGCPPSSGEYPKGHPQVHEGTPGVPHKFRRGYPWGCPISSGGTPQSSGGISRGAPQVQGGTPGCPPQVQGIPQGAPPPSSGDTPGVPPKFSRGYPQGHPPSSVGVTPRGTLLVQGGTPGAPSPVN